MPFFTEYLFQRLLVDTGLAPAGESVHFQSFPEPDPSRLDAPLEARVETARAAIALGLVIREREKLGVRRPLARVTVASPDPAVRGAIEQLADALRGELNVKEVETIADDAALCRVSAKANFKRLGKRLGPKMKAIAARVEALDTGELARLARGEKLELEGEVLEADDVLLSREARLGTASESRDGITVVLDTEVTPELLAEGLARELVSRIQNLRKTAELSVSQRIRLSIDAGSSLDKTLENRELRELVQRETLTTELTRAPRAAFPADALVKDESIDGEPLVLGLTPALSQ